MRFRLNSLLALLLWIGAGDLFAHDSPEHQVELLTSIMTSQGKSSSLLLKRAAEYRALGQGEKAILDLKEALVLNPSTDFAWKELGRLYLAQGKHSLALEAVNKALSTSSDEEEKASSYM